MVRNEFNKYMESFVPAPIAHKSQAVLISSAQVVRTLLEKDFLDIGTSMNSRCQRFT